MCALVIISPVVMLPMELEVCMSPAELMLDVYPMIGGIMIYCFEPASKYEWICWIYEYSVVLLF